MSDKKLVADALSDSPDCVPEMVVNPGFFVSPDYCPSSRAYPFDARQGCTRVVYPPNTADQIHGLSVAEMVRNGQGQVLEEDLSNYDYLDEKGKKFKDDGSLEVHSMQELEWADPAEIFEQSQNLEKDFQNSITVKVDTDKLKASVPDSKKSVEDSKKTETSQDTSVDKNGSTK